jgi:hypothetical protein
MNLYTNLQKATNEEIEGVIKELDTNTLLFILKEINTTLDLKDNLRY